MKNSWFNFLKVNSLACIKQINHWRGLLKWISMHPCTVLFSFFVLHPCPCTRSGINRGLSCVVERVIERAESSSATDSSSEDFVVKRSKIDNISCWILWRVGVSWLATDRPWRKALRYTPKAEFALFRATRELLLRAGQTLCSLLPGETQEKGFLPQYS